MLVPVPKLENGLAADGFVRRRPPFGQLLVDPPLVGPQPFELLLVEPPLVWQQLVGPLVVDEAPLDSRAVAQLLVAASFADHAPKPLSVVPGKVLVVAAVDVGRQEHQRPFWPSAWPFDAAADC